VRSGRFTKRSYTDPLLTSSNHVLTPPLHTSVILSVQQSSLYFWAGENAFPCICLAARIRWGDHFESFLLKKPQGVITNGNIPIGDGWAQDAGKVLQTAAVLQW
jgi:hypothetical protein